MELPAEISTKREAILEMAARHGARNVRIFGSALHGDFGDESDVDLLVEMESDRTFFDRAALKEDLESLLGRPVDVLTEDSIYWLLKRKIIREARAL
ncbi:MAG: nucleotidyltransferase family protein [Chrysiogenetes bacterium]|nr:nucleotidyltransferase family protein [Chrysiogenetes bacterium]